MKPQSDNPSPAEAQQDTPQGGQAAAQASGADDGQKGGRALPLLGEVLVKEGIITERQLETALEAQKEAQKPIGRLFVEMGFATEADILTAISKYYRIVPDSLSDNIQEMIRRRRASIREWLSNLRVPIRIKLSIAIILVIWVTVLVLSFIILNRQREHLYQQTVQTGMVSLNYFTENAKVPLLDNNVLRLNQLVKEAAAVEGLVYGIIVDRSNKVKAHSDVDRIGEPLPAFRQVTNRTERGNTEYFDHVLPGGTKVLNLSRPVSFRDKVLGTIHVGVSLDFISNQIQRETLYILLLSVLLAALGIAVAVFLGIGFARPISQLVLATQEIGRGNYTHKVRMLRNDEFEDLATSFNYMSRELWRKLTMEKSFGRYVSPEVLDLILSSPEEDWLRGTRNEASILFTDVRGFTSFSEGHEPEQVVEALNAYFQIATKAIMDYGGYIDKFIGDAVLGVFGVPVKRPDHAERCVRAAMQMQRDLFAEADRSGNELLRKVGIGINSGVLVAGNIGSEVKMEYTVIGDTVNVASRLNHLAQSGEVVISEATRDAIGQELLELVERPPQEVKGKSEPIQTFLVTTIHDRTGSA